MGTYNDEAVVLRTHRLGEADRIITVLTRRHGKLRGVAKGVRRTSSKFGARLEPFAQVDLQITETRSLGIFTSVVSKNLFGKDLLDDYTRYTAAEVMVEIADKMVVEEGVPAVQHYLLLVGALKALTQGTTDGVRSSMVIMDSYVLRAASLAGYAPQLECCAVCGAAGPHSWFHPGSGGITCYRCHPNDAISITSAVLAYLVALLTGDWPATRLVESAVITQASGLVRTYLDWHLERSIKSYDHFVRQGHLATGK